jgi:hypothetical protein
MAAFTKVFLACLLGRAAALPPSRASGFEKRQDAPPVLTAPLPTGTDPLECFQVAQPVLGPSGPVIADTVVQPEGSGLEGKKCEVLLMEHVFAWSYGFPFIGKRLSLFVARPLTSFLTFDFIWGRKYTVVWHSGSLAPRSVVVQHLWEIRIISWDKHIGLMHDWGYFRNFY